jgi:hypothetical protein
MNPAQPSAQAVAVAGGRIVYVGDREGVARLIGAATRVRDLHGQMVLPGFHDSHVHIATGGIELGECNLNGIEPLDALRAAIRACATETAGPEGWLRGGGWELPVFPASGPTRGELDALVPDRPVYLTSADGHSAWVSSRAVELAGIEAETPDPPNGRIERDPATGEATGTLRETAMALVEDLIPPYTHEASVEGVRRGLALAASYGITSLNEADASPALLAAYADLDRRGELTATVLAAQSTDAARGPEQLAALVRLRDAHHGDHLSANAIKIFVDGVIEAQTAALLEPYDGRPDWRGEPRWAPEELNRLVAEADRLGFQVHMHAIGDRAIRMALDAIARARAEHGPRDVRHILAHIQLFDPTDITRMSELGVIGSVQPLWAYADRYITELTEPVLGPTRSRWLYPIHSLAEAGVVLAFGSDWSVSSMNPLLGMQVGVTRQAVTGDRGAPWIPEERVELETMLAGYTTAGAFAAFLEEEVGSIEVGKRADLVVLDRNLFDLPPTAIGSALVRRTIFEGREVYVAADR